MPLVNRQALLSALLSVEPGISPRETVAQSNCVVLRNGRFFTYNEEIACSMVSGLPVDMDGVMAADRLIKLLGRLPEEELQAKIDGGCFKIKGKGRLSEIPMQREILLPVDGVEIPTKGDWEPLSADYAEAVDLVYRCAQKRHEDFARTCVHVCTNRLEACDGYQGARYMTITPIRHPCLVRASALKEIVQLGMTRVAETPNWLHFRNPAGLRLSMQKYALDQDGYPDLSMFLDRPGTLVHFPKGLADESETAALFVDDDGSGGSILVEVQGDMATVSSRGVTGRHQGEKKLPSVNGRPQNQGSRLMFLVPPKLFIRLIQKHGKCEVSDRALRVVEGPYTYATVLEVLR